MGTKAFVIFLFLKDVTPLGGESQEFCDGCITKTRHEEEGVKKRQNMHDVIYGRPHRRKTQVPLKAPSNDIILGC